MNLGVTVASTETAPTHIVFSPPRIRDGVLHRGVVATDDEETIPTQLRRDLWTVAVLLHGATIPVWHREVDLYMTSATFAEKCPQPQVHLTARNFVDEATYYPLGIPKQVDVIFNVTWVPCKRHELMIDALTWSKQRGRPISCLWFGYHWCSGWEQREADLRSEVQRRKLNVTFAEVDFNAAEINRRYNVCRSALICSSREAGPRVMTEAMLADIPYIATSDTYGGSPELVTSDCGIVCEPTGQGIASAIWRACDERSSFAPRAWAQEYLCTRASLPILRQSLVRVERERGWRINLDELCFPGIDWLGRLATVRNAEAAL